MATSFTRGVVVIEGVVFIASVGGRWAFADYPVLGLIAFDIGLFITPGFPISDVLINRDQTGFSRSGQPSRVNMFCRSSIKVVGDAHVIGVADRLTIYVQIIQAVYVVARSVNWRQA